MSKREREGLDELSVREVSVDVGDKVATDQSQSWSVGRSLCEERG